ncbi:hypothetical protein EVJ58_g2263 [Rhodofomes roseus]|uniref:Uncharacterized protein n=1 Tax=Rhodofomes roseus TaxID=34475 RepID=A0A4Y9YV18_9APHY|nr:hypothetical protein EVJ58_g2263 [Rhodofomes roseus]
MGSRWCDIKIEGSAKIVGSAALDTFMLHKFGMLKEDMMKRWHEYATRSEALAHDSQAQALQPLIDCTLDGLHSSAFMRTLQEEFSAVQQADRAGQRQLHFTNPLDKLRARIPKCETPAIVGYAFDPILDLRDHDEHAWDDSYREATDVYCRFCQDLEEALKRDGMATSDGHGVLTHGISTSYSHADGVFASYRGRYFEGDSSFTKHIQSIRASAWYYFGYAQKNPAFAWLGLAYLNRIRNDRVTQGPSTSIGAASGALGGTTSSTSSASCVSSTATVVGMSLSLKEAASRGARRAQENLRSVEKNPTPRYPVASNPPPCVNAPEHKWRMGPTNGFARRYDCETCGVRVKERKEGVYWVEDVVTSAKAAQGPRRIAKLPRPIKVANAGRELVQRGVEAPSVKGEDIDDKKGILNPAATSARAIGTSPKSLKDSSQRDVKPVPSSTARGQPSTTNGLLISRSSISTGIKSRPTGSDLVCNNAKPSAPVAAHPGLAECRSDQHLWHCRWANGYARHYICKWCSIVVKEHKRNDRWVAY